MNPPLKKGVRGLSDLKIHYNPKLKKYAQELRKNTTFSERLLWKYLKGRQIRGYQFSRQKPIMNYIVDFYCSKLNLIIEIDGESHNDKLEYDTQRENNLKANGFKILKFDGHFVIKDITETLEMIESKIVEIERKTTPYPPLIRGDLIL